MPPSIIINKLIKASSDYTDHTYKAYSKDWLVDKLNNKI